MEQSTQGRVIKFRAWDTSKKEWINPGALAVLGSGYLMTYSSQGWGARYSEIVKIMQWTGLTDKNGTEIYEGDVVQYDLTEEINHWVAGEKAVVVWMPPRFSFRTKPFEEFNGTNQNLPNEDDTKAFVTVIGNIYENPELLK